jgi:methionyl-tRNA formyltransferase
MVNAPALRVVFFGTPQFAVPTLERILASRHPVVAAVTQPDRPRGRGQQVSDSPVKAAAAAAGVPVLQPARLKDAAVVDQLTALRADIGVVAAYGRILTDAVLATPRLGMINVHASLLPRHRGAAPIHRAVMAGDPVTGVTIMRVVAALDAGAMLAAIERPIGANDTSDEVEADLAQLGAALLVDTLDRLAAGPIVETPQDDARATYAAKITKDDGVIHWNRSAVEIHNQVRGLYPWPHASSHIEGRRVIIWRSSVLDDAASVQAVAGPASDEAPGTIVRAGSDGIDVATGHGTLRLTELQAEGKRVLKVRDYLAGHRLTPGSRFGAAP